MADGETGGGDNSTGGNEQNQFGREILPQYVEFQTGGTDAFRIYPRRSLDTDNSQ